jgi:hypothetical protein
MHVQEPAITTAAALSLHWDSGDIEAVVILLADISGQEEAEDIITSLLVLRNKSADDLRKLLIHA